MRVVILGNSGSGKTWLAVRLAQKFGPPVVHLDDIFWQPGGFNEKRDPAEVACLVSVAKSQSDWIAEGVYGHLAQQFLPCASTLVWLEMPWHICRMRLELRGSESKAHMGREQSEAGLRELVDWAESTHRVRVRAAMQHTLLCSNPSKANATDWAPNQTLWSIWMPPNA